VRIVNLKVKNIKKLMGWCPNAKMTETGSRISDANFEANDRSGGEKADRSGREKASNKVVSQKFSKICSIIYA
jgi:hypothetical protein